MPYHLTPKSLTSYYLSYLCFTYWQSPFVSSRKGTIHSGLSIHHPKQKQILGNKWQPSEKQSVPCIGTKVRSRKGWSALFFTLCIHTSLKHSHWTYYLWRAGGTAPFWSLRKQNQVWNHSFTANTNTPRGSHQLWGEQPSFSALLGEIRQPLGQLSWPLWLARSYLMGYAFWEDRLWSRQQCHTDLRAVFEELFKSQIVLRNPVPMWGSLQGNNRHCSLQSLHFKDWRGHIFYLFFSYLTFF